MVATTYSPPGVTKTFLSYTRYGIGGAKWSSLSEFKVSSSREGKTFLSQEASRDSKEQQPDRSAAITLIALRVKAVAEELCLRRAVFRLCCLALWDY